MNWNLHENINKKHSLSAFQNGTVKLHMYMGSVKKLMQVQG